MHAREVDAAPEAVTLRSALRVWARIGLLSFGGPAGQIALMHRVLVDELRWIGEARFLHALSYCMLLPGPEATQLAIYVGWLLHRTAGGLAAGLLFVFPGMVTILALSLLYVTFKDLPIVAALFSGVKPAVVAVVIEALVRMGKRGLGGPPQAALAAAAFLAIFFLEVPFPLIVLGAGLLGFFAERLRPGALVRAARAGGTERDASALLDRLIAEGRLEHLAPSRARALKVLAVGLAVWGAPLVALRAALGESHVLVEEGLFFSGAAMVTFGGAYAVLAYVAQEAVSTFGWLAPSEMLDGLGLAETTPGPLIMVVQFVGFMGAYHHPGTLSPYVAALAGSAVTTWVTFVPCFLWIFLGAPWVEALRGSRVLGSALAAISAAVVGVILNLSIWFALHVLFEDVSEVRSGPVRLLVPTLSSADPLSLGIAVAAGVAMLRFKVGMLPVLAAAALVGLVRLL